MKRILIRVGVILVATVVLIILLTIGFSIPLVEHFEAWLLIIYVTLEILVFIIGIGAAGIYVLRNIQDVTCSKKDLLQVKPFLFRIDNLGKIELFNTTCENNIRDIAKFKTVYDFALIRESYDVMKDIERQLPLTVVFESTATGPLFVRFLILKSGKKYCLIGENITQHRKDSEFHRNIPLYNSVTKLPSKNYFGIKLQELFDNPAQLLQKNSLVAIDISGFRNINKLFGYRVADQTLIELGKILQEIVEQKSSLYHLEEDTFAVLFRNTAPEAVEKWAESLLEILSKPLRVEDNLFTIEVNIGIFHIDPKTYSQLNPVITLHNAQLALIKAGSSDKTKIVVYDPELGEAHEREELMKIDLAQALAKEEFYLHFQPQYNVLTQRITGFEALIRWNNPKYLSYTPAKFIEIAEQNNLIINIGRYVLHESLKFAKLVENEQIRLSINVSPIQLLHQGFVEELLQVYDDYQLQSQQVSLEITENFLIETHKEISQTLRLLKNKGYRILLDHFGTGYTSMLYLQDFPIDGISIHRDWIKNVLTDKNARQMVLRIISLALSLDLEIIAEGVETEKQNEFLRENGCNIIQGHLISKAVSQEEALLILRNYNKN